MGHGAGRGADTADLLAIARELPAAGVTVALVDQPWVLAGRRVAAPAAALDDAWTEVVHALRGDELAGLPLVVGGRSTGARVACRTAGATAADGLLLLAFPLRPPGNRNRPERAAAALEVRRQEWAGTSPLPITLVQGDRDAFGSGAEVLATVDGARAELFSVPGADHSLRARGAGTDATVEAILIAAAQRAAGRVRGATGG